MIDQNQELTSLNLEQFKWTGATAAPRVPHTPLPQRFEREEFFGGPIPMRWLKRAGTLPGKSVLLAILLWHWAVMDRHGNQTRVRPGVARDAGLTRNTMYRALDTLESAGLIAVTRQRGRSARVEILDVPRS